MPLFKIFVKKIQKQKISLNQYSTYGMNTDIVALCPVVGISFERHLLMVFFQIGNLLENTQNFWVEIINRKLEKVK